MSPRRKAPETRIQRAGRTGHIYYLDGEKVPGVTTILGNGIPKGGLIGWAANTVAEYVVNRLRVERMLRSGGLDDRDGVDVIVADDLVADLLAWNATRDYHAAKVGSDRLPRLALAEILAAVRYIDVDTASGRGTEVHRLAAALAQGEEVDVPEELDGHVRSYLRFLDEWDPTEALVERVVINREWRYMGRFDLCARFPEYGVGLLDVKTSRSGVFSETALQLAGYANGEAMLDGLDTNGVAVEVPMPRFDWFGVVWVRADGYDVIPFDVGRAEWRAFLYAKQVGEWLDWKEGRAAEVKGAALRAPKILDEGKRR